MNKLIIILSLMLLFSLSLVTALDYTDNNQLFIKAVNVSDEAEALQDLSVNGYTLTNNGSTGWSSANGFDCDGGNDLLFIDVDNTTLDLENEDVVICAWVKFDTTSDLGNRFIQKGDSGDGGFTYGMNSNNDIDFLGGSATQIFKRVANGDEFTDTSNTHLWCANIDRDNDATYSLYLDGVPYTSYQQDSTSTNSYTTTEQLKICYGEGNYFNGQIKAVYYWKGVDISQDFTQTELTFIYDEGEQWNPYNLTLEYNITLTQDPADLNLLSVGIVTINASVLGNNGSISNSSYASIYYNETSNGSLNSIYYLYNDTSYDINFTENMTKVNNSYFTSSIDENDYLPAIYPFDIHTVESTPKSDYAIYSTNSLLFNVLNISSSTKNNFVIEFNAEPVSTSLSQDMYVYQCEYLNPLNCSVIDILINTDLPQHQHSNYSSHYISFVPPEAVNNISFKFDMPSSGNVAKRWDLRYFLNASYSSSNIFQTSTDGVTFTNSSNVFDIHVHQFDENELLSYEVTFYDGGGVNATKNGSDDLNFTNLPPSGVFIDEPTGTFVLNSTGVNVYFNWTASTDANNDTLYYKLAVGINNPTLNLTGFVESSLSANVSLINTMFTNSSYRAFVYISDLEEVTLSRQDDPFFICLNNWTTSEATCISGYQNVTYVDSNSCSIEYDQPSSFIQACTDSNSSDWKFLVIFIFFISILILLTFLVHPAFLGLAGLIIGVMTPFTFVPMLANTLFVVLLFVVSGVFIVVSFMMGLKAKE